MAFANYLLFRGLRIPCVLGSLPLHQAHFGICLHSYGCKYESGRFLLVRGGRFDTFRFKPHYLRFVAIGVYFLSILKETYYLAVRAALFALCQESYLFLTRIIISR